MPPTDTDIYPDQHNNVKNADIHYEQQIYSIYFHIPLF